MAPMRQDGTDEDATEDGLRERGFCDDGFRDLNGIVDDAFSLTF